jgi:hypothetical protein
VGYVALAGLERRLAEKVSDDWTRNRSRGTDSRDDGSLSGSESTC